MRQPQSPNAWSPNRQPADQDDQERKDDPHRRRGLDPARIKAAFAVGRVLGDVGRRTAVFAAQGETLQDPHADQQDRSEGPDYVIARQQADDEGRRSHQSQGQHEGEFAADQVAQMAEEDRAEGPNEKTRPEHEKTCNEGDRRVQLGREEMLAEKEREHAVEIEVVPLDQRADRGGTNDPRQAQGARRDASTGSVC